MVVRRGEIWWALLRPPRGSEPGYPRPVLVMQADSFNTSRIRTVLVVAITSNVGLARAPGNVLLSRKSSGLPKPSVANVSQIITLDRSFLQRKVKILARRELAQVDAGLKRVLSLV